MSEFSLSNFPSPNPFRIPEILKQVKKCLFLSFECQILEHLSWADLGNAMLVSKKWAQVIRVILVAVIVTILDHQVGVDLWASFPLHLRGHKLITFKDISRL